MIKQTATYDDWKVVRHDDNKIEVYMGGELCPKSAPALRVIAEELGMDINPEWRTAQLGQNVMKAMLAAQKEEPAEASKEETKAGEEMNTYYLRVESPVLWRFDTVELENADDEEMAEAFEEQFEWANIIGETSNLYVRKDEMDNEEDLGCDEEVVEKLASIIGENEVNSTTHMPDADESFSIVVMDENHKELETIESDDIVAFECEHSYAFELDNFDEEEPAYEAAKQYMEKNEVCEGDKEYLFPMTEPERWFWLNVQKCNPEEHAVLKLRIPGKFDASKLSFKRTLVEEIIGGLNSMVVISAILYDGKIIEVEDDALCEEDEHTNYVIKMDDRCRFSEKVYDMTNFEEA